MKLIPLLLLGMLVSSCSTTRISKTNEPQDVVNNSEEAENKNAVEDAEIQSTSTKDTIHIGANRTFTSLTAYFAAIGTVKDVHLLVDEGTYYSKGLYIDAENTVIEGIGRVNLYCSELYENIMWLTGNNIVVKNIHMKHFAPGKPEGQNCSGRVIGFDNAHNVTIENCDLNGCGLAGLHDNLLNSDILIKNNYIHNNSLGAYTDIDGGVWQKEVDNHPVFRFENNRMVNNGPNRSIESDSLSDFIVVSPEGYEDELKQNIEYEREAWKNVPNPFVAKYVGNEFGDYFHLNFEDANGNSYDFGFGNNDFGDIVLYYEDDELSDNPAFLGKQFNIYWEWRISSFPCCSGDYEMAEAFLPSIIRLELIDK